MVRQRYIYTKSNTYPNMEVQAEFWTTALALKASERDERLEGSKPLHFRSDLVRH